MASRKMMNIPSKHLELVMAPQQAKKATTEPSSPRARTTQERREKSDQLLLRERYSDTSSHTATPAMDRPNNITTRFTVITNPFRQE